MNILTKIIAYKKAEILGIECKYKTQNPSKSELDFLAFLQQRPQTWPKLIAEIKKKSPSKGDLFPEADIIKIAKIYEKNGAAAISCLSDKPFFGGSLDVVKKISKTIHIPVLRKDFIIHLEQIKEARIFGAHAILLMTSILKTKTKLRAFREYAESFGMHCLVETHNAREIEEAVASGAKIIGVNSRNFEDPNLKVDIKNFQKLLPLIPKNITRVAESGLSDVRSIDQIKGICDVILVGTHFMSLQDYSKIETEVQKFTQS